MFILYLFRNLCGHLFYICNSGCLFVGYIFKLLLKILSILEMGKNPENKLVYQ